MGGFGYDDPEIGKKALRRIMVNGARERKEIEDKKNKEDKEKQKRDKIFQIRLALFFFLLGVIVTVIVTMLTK